MQAEGVVVAVGWDEEGRRLQLYSRASLDSSSSSEKSEQRLQKVPRRRPGALTLSLQNKAFVHLGNGRATNSGEVNRLHLGAYLAMRSPVKNPLVVAEASALREIFDHLRQG